MAFGGGKEKTLTGYPSIDKPQNSFYRSETVRVINAEQTIYEMVFGCNVNNMYAPALGYLGVLKYFRCVESLPYTQNGKYDFRLLEQMGNEFVESLL